MLSRSLFLLACLLAVDVFACSSSSKPPSPTGCGDGVAVSDGCAGVPVSAVCSGGTCTQGVTCASVVNAASDADLANAVASASAGTCIALQPGTYGDASLPGGVSLLGRAASDVHLDGVVVGSGMGAVVRGLSVGAGGLQIADGAQAARIDSVRVDSASGNGVTIGKGVQVTLASTTVTHAGSGQIANGVVGLRGADLTLDHVLVESSNGPGLWMEACANGCQCTGTASLTAHGTVLQSNQLVGASLHGVNATLGDVTITSTTELPAKAGPAGGLVASQCSSVTTDGPLSVTNNAQYGVLIDHASATLGQQDAPVVITGQGAHSGNRNGGYGIWIQGVGQSPAPATQSVTLVNLGADDNNGVGIGLDGSSRSIIIQGGHASNNASSILPATKYTWDPQMMVWMGSPVAESIGDGLSWNAGVEAKIDGLTLSGNGRADMLVTGQWANGSSAANLNVDMADTHGIIIQGGYGLPPGVESLPQGLVSQVQSEQYAVAAGPAPPAGVQ